MELKIKNGKYIYIYMDTLFYYLGINEVEILPDPKQLRLRHLLMKQIKNTNIKLFKQKKKKKNKKVKFKNDNIFDNLYDG